jgi:mannitol-specific phosphotransferase system IIBC component
MPDRLLDTMIGQALGVLALLLLLTGGLYGAALVSGRRGYWIAAVVTTALEVVGFVGLAKGWFG